MRLAILLVLLSIGGTASAASCGGTLVDYKPLRSNGQLIGQLQLYYNAGNGRNCAVMKHAESTWGVPKYTFVRIAECATRACDGSYKTGTSRGNEGTFRYEAGPVRISGRGRCIFAVGGLAMRPGPVPQVMSNGHCR